MPAMRPSLSCCCPSGMGASNKHFHSCKDLLEGYLSFFRFQHLM